jgi:hypothetical protein
LVNLEAVGLAVADSTVDEPEDIECLDVGALVVEEFESALQPTPEGAEVKTRFSC